MLEKGKISGSQFIILTFMFIIGTFTSLATPLVILQAKQDSWLSAIISISFGILLTWIFGSLAKRNPQMTLIECCEFIMGKWAGKTIASLYFIFFLLLTSGLVRMIGDLITTRIMTETPIIAVEIAYMLIVIYGVRLGLETFARTSETVFPWVIIFSLLSGFLLFPLIKTENMSPVLEEGLNPVFRGAYQLIGISFLDVIVLLMIAPFVGESKKVQRGLLIAILAGGTGVIGTILLCITVLGSDLSAQLNYPLYDLAERIDIGEFVQGIEVLSGGILFITIFIKIIICFYSLVLSLAQITNLREYRGLTFPMGIIVLFLSIFLFPNIIYFKEFVSKVWTPFSFIYGLFFPLILLLVDRLKRGKSN